jgi:flavin-dependent dehydrogenase
LELLSGRAHESLRQLSLLEAVTRDVPTCGGVISRWGAATTERPALLDPDGGGWIVDRAIVDAAVLDAAVKAGVHWRATISRNVRPAGAGWRVAAADAWHRCERVVLATGRASNLALRCGLRRPCTSRLVAVVGWVAEPIDRLGDRLYVADAEDGWSYALGCDRGTSMGFCTDLDLLPGPANYAHGVRRRPAFTGAVIGEPPAEMQVVGDAALAVDPLSGHGLALAFEGSLRAARDPGGYPEWLARITESHAIQEQGVYAAAGRTGEFWRRRIAS